MVNPRFPGAPIISSLVGNELVAIATVGQASAQTTTADIAALASSVSLNPESTSITTVGAGTLTAAAVVGGVIVRSGPVAAFTDTTATAALIIAALPVGTAVGSSWFLTYKNLTAFTGTLAAGVGVTLSGNKDVVSANSAGVYLVTYATASTITIQGLYVVPLTGGVAVQYATAALESATISAASVAGANLCNFINTGTTPANLQFPAATDLVAAIPNARIGYSYQLLIRNGSGGANTATITTNTGITLTGTMTIAQNATRTFVVTLTSLSAVVVQSMALATGA